MGKVIAVVDDEIRIRETIKSYLQNEGFDIVEGEDGNSAIQLIKDSLCRSNSIRCDDAEYGWFSSFTGDPLFQ